jgi:hypothetical protein
MGCVRLCTSDPGGDDADPQEKSRQFNGAPYFRAPPLLRRGNSSAHNTLDIGGRREHDRPLQAGGRQAQGDAWVNPLRLDPEYAANIDVR